MFDWVDWVGLGIVLAAIVALGLVWLWPRGRNDNNAGDDRPM